MPGMEGEEEGMPTDNSLQPLHTQNGPELDNAEVVSTPKLECSFSENQENGTKAQEKESKMYFSFALLSSHSLIRKQGKVYRCDVCTLTYRHVFSLKRHFLRNHVTRKYISPSDLNNCKITTKGDRLPDFDASSNSSTSSTGKESQASMENSPVKDIILAGLYRCHMCKNVNFDKREEIREHYLKHPTKSRFHCEKCNVVFSNKQALYRHLTSHAGESSFPCTTCSEIFDSKADYLKHAATHTDGRTCKYCFKILSTKANKCRHERIHEGLKPYPCKHCKLEFSQSADLKQHILKEHSSLYISCKHCTGLFSSKAALKKHMVDRHETAKSHPSSPNIPMKQDIIDLPSSSKKKPFVSSMSTSQTKKKSVIPPSQTSSTNEGITHCTVCRKPYRSYIGMMHHRRKAHPFATTGRKVHKRKKYYTRSARQKMFSQVNADKVSEEDFYRGISTSIAENLLNYVDGKTSQLSLRQYNFSEQIEQPLAMSSQSSWSTYNFPSSFDVNKALHDKGQEVKNRSPETNTSSVEILNGFSSCSRYDETTDNSEQDMECSDVDGVSTFSCKSYADYLNIDIEERKKLIGRKVESVIICNVCKERISSHKAFEDHSVNNHPNVVCTFVEIEGDKDVPPVVPEDMRWQFLSPVGVYFSCSVPPPMSESSTISCTKCKILFSTISELHGHIISCGGVVTPHAHVKKTAPYRKIKRTMKKRINIAWVSKVKKKIVLNGTKPSSIKEKHRTPSKEKSPTANKEGGSSVVRSNVGRPNNNVKIICPHCQQTFKSKSLLNNHINRCYKRLVMKSKCLNATMKKADSGRKKQPEHPVIQKKKINMPTHFTEKSVKVLPDVPEIEVPAERLSPSLQLIVESIKEKLTAEELSPPTPAFSWMEPESFISIPQAIIEPEEVIKNTKSSNSKPCGYITLGSEVSNSDITKVSSNQQKKIKNVNVMPVKNLIKTCGLIPAGEPNQVMKLVSINSSTKIIRPDSPEVAVNLGEKIVFSRTKSMNLSKVVNEAVPKMVQSDQPVPEQSTVSSLKPVNFYKKAKLPKQSTINENKSLFKDTNCIQGLPDKTSVEDSLPKKALQKHIPLEVISSSGSQTTDHQSPATIAMDLELLIDGEKSLPNSKFSATEITTNKSIDFPSDLSLSSKQIQVQTLKSKVASFVLDRVDSSNDCDDPMPIDVMETQQTSSSEEPKSSTNKAKLKCPYCLQVFAFLYSFHRHISVCEERYIKKEAEDSQQTNPVNLLVLPKKDEVEESMISLLRHQSRQSKMMKEAQTDEAVDVKNFQAYTCESCHKIFFSLFKLLKHRVVHKLQLTNNKETNNPESDNLSCPPSTSSDFLQGIRETSPGPSYTSAHSESSNNAKHKSNSEMQQLVGDDSVHEANLPKDSSNPELSEQSCSDQVVESPMCEIPSTTAVVDAPKEDGNDLDVQQSTAPASSEGTQIKEETMPPSIAETSTGSVCIEEGQLDEAESSTAAPRVKRRKRMKTIVVRKRPLLFKRNMKEKMKLKRQMESSFVSITQGNSPVGDLDNSASSEDKEIIDEKMEPDLVTESPVDEAIVPDVKSSTKKSKKSTSDNPVDRTCPICSKVFGAKAYIKRHIIIMHSSDLSNPKPLGSKPKKGLVKKKKKQMRNTLKRICKKEVPSKKIFVKKHLLPSGKIRK